MGFPSNCPNCQAVLVIEGNRKVAYCEFCGTKLLQSNTSRRLDIAEKKADNEAERIRNRRRQLKNEAVLHRLDHAERMRIADERRKETISNLTSRVLKALGKVALFPTWLLILTLIVKEIQRRSFLDGVWLFIVLLLVFFIGGIFVIIFTIKKW